ncbi:RIP metalloprotease RseP [Anaerosalibacter bizertensis]|uniref:Zinc metalloprotease n=1 Tax=Anaerosalibacter bizertensis TaxID=932217 RepID=A0A844FG77_9FIRM|nr:RIP metalloprotease RseP [Anaerosalibacter bizertensis]MSS42971.1 RIP metalloprotease RseP [Anaerosalibacter bizertensis]
MNTALAAIFVFMIVILFHEFGHFITAKMVGIKVHEFSIGMGPRLFHKTKGETDYSIRVLPIGGYVRMEGEDESSNDPKSFNKKPIGSRILVVAAGAIMNFILAIIVFTIVSYGTGMPTTIIDEVIVDSPAYNVGLKAGDRIISVNNTETKSWKTVVEKISDEKSTEDMEVIVLRGSEKKEFLLRPEFDKEIDRYVIGIVPQMKKSFSSAIKGGIEKTGMVLGLMFQFLKMLFTGQVKKGDLSGPVGVIYTVGEAAKYGFINVLYITGFISVNLGFFNLLPLPALDGSRILFMLIELFRGKPINPEKEGFIHFIGFVLLIILMVFVTYSDIVRFF